MEDVDRYRLLHGPYSAPACRRGDVLTCEARGRDVTVGGMSDGRISWPRAMKNGRPSLILCGDLIRAVRMESEIAVSHWWGVSIVVVWGWRKALSVPRITDGTGRLYREYKPEKLTDDVAAAGRDVAASPESRAKMSETKRGKPASPGTRAALLKASKAPKSDAWKAAASKRNKELWRKRRTGEAKTPRTVTPKTGPKICVECGADYTGWPASQTCSAKCRRTRRNRLRAELLKTLEDQ